MLFEVCVKFSVMAISTFKSKSRESFKIFVKRKIMEFEFERLMNMKDRENRSKMNDLRYT